MAKDKTAKTKDAADLLAASASGTSDGKTKALGLAMEQIEKQFGKGSIMKLGEHRGGA
jgi:hypothetical protein